MPAGATPRSEASPGRASYCGAMQSPSPRGIPRFVDCAVVGAGVVGAAVAQALTRRGLRVAVLDTAPGIGGGCSYANAALLAPHHVTPLVTPALLREAPAQMVRRPAALRVSPHLPLMPWMARLAASSRSSVIPGQRLRELALESTDLHIQLAGQGLNPTLRKTGAVDVYLRRPRRQPADALTPQQLSEFEPSLTGVMVGTYEADEWTVESRSFVRAMLDDAQAHGAEILFDTPVLGLLGEDGQVTGVETAAGTIRAGHVVLAAGLATRTLGHQVGLNLPLRGGRGHVVDVESPGDSAPRIPVRIKEHRIVVTPLEDRVRVCGSIEFGPESRPVDPRHGAALLDVAVKVLPALRDQPVIERWSGDRPCSPDGLPIIGPSELVENLSVAAGHGMWGMILAPVTARMLTAAIVDGEAAPADGEFSADRFSRPSRDPRSGRPGADGDRSWRPGTARTWRERFGGSAR